MRTLLPLYETVMEKAGAALASLAGIGVTNGPGLTGSLLVGLSFAKALAYASGVPLAGIHHIEGHILANALEGPLELPALVLVVSGGHTQLVQMERVGRYEVIGSTRDDAAGEAFDKIGKLLGLPFPGRAVDRARGARGKRARPTIFPGAFGIRADAISPSRGSRPPCGSRWSRSTSSRRGSSPTSPLRRRRRSSRASSRNRSSPRGRGGADRFYLAGGVASNGRLREALAERLAAAGVTVAWPRPEYCTDNAAMIACAASYHIRAGRTDGLELNSFARGNLSNWAA